MATENILRCFLTPQLQKKNYQKKCLGQKYLLSLGMGGSNISKSFEKLLHSKIWKNMKTLMNIGVCPPHTVSYAFLE